MSERSKKFLSYYRPYLKLFLADMFCAMIAAGITLVFPMIIRYITLLKKALIALFFINLKL